MPTRSAFEERYATLNAEQRQAVDTLVGPVMVIAGPGTGKTEVLTMRIANILRRAATGDGGVRTPPEKILALTFTESAAASIRRRLVELVGAEAYRVEISTFHGFANRVIRDYPDYFPTIVGGASITEIEQVDILRRLIDTLPDLRDLRPFNDRYHHLRAILVAIGELKRQAVSPEAFVAIAEDAARDLRANPDFVNQSGKHEGKIKSKYVSVAKQADRNVELAEIYAAYQKALVAANQYDYSDMIMYVVHALETNDELLRVLQDSYEYFLVDEHQDTNNAQNRIVELVAGGVARPNLFVVGDEKQAIFRFQGASLENFRYFRDRYNDVLLITLSSNYRSTQTILDAAQGVSPRETALMARAGYAEGPVHLAVFAAADIEYYFIARKIKELVAAGMPADRIAVLYRDNRDVVSLVRTLEKEKVPFIIESDQDVLGDEEMKKLVRILRAVQRFGSDAALAEALHVDFLGVAPIDVYKLLAYAAREKKRLYEAVRSPALLDAAGVDSASKTAYGRLFEALSGWRRAAKNQGATEAFEKIVYESGFLKALLDHPVATEKLAKLHALFDIVKSLVERQKNYTLDDFFRYLDLMEEHGLAVRSTDTVRLPGRVRLMTAHRAKGLEFDAVFIMNAVDGKWGSRHRREVIKLPARIYRPATEDAAGDGDDASAVDDADERNVFYVALTRAQKELFITLSKADRDGKEQLPTPFIAELKEDVLSPLNVAPYEKEFAARRDEIEFAPVSPRAPELRDKEFLNELFRAQGLSVTALNNYLKCPWAYFYRSLVRIPEAPDKNRSFGIAVHAALKSYFDALSASAGGAPGSGRGKEHLIRRFEEALAREAINEREYEEALEKGRRALRAFYDEYHSTWSPRALIERRIEGIVLEDGTLINGTLDRVEFLNGPADGDRDPVRVIDYKTGKPKSRNEIEGLTKASDGNYKRQIVFYKLLLDKEGKRDMRSGIIQFVEPDDHGKMRHVELAVTPGDVSALEKLVMDVARKILDLSFWNEGCREPDCRYCELRKGME